MSIFSGIKKLFRMVSVESNSKKQWNKNIKKDIDPLQIWDLISDLGDGAFGIVKKAQNKETGMYAALKQVNITSEEELEDFSVEINILAECVHPNVVGLVDAYFFQSKLWMFIEYCGGGALDGIMVELEKPLTEPQIRHVCRDMCVALEFLHRRHVIHRDIKAGNVLLTTDGDVKLADFGVSAKNDVSHQRRDTFIGTPFWMAPEVIMCETLKDNPYDYMADIWSLGITMIEFAQIAPPYKDMHPMRVLIKIQKAAPPSLERPRKWSPEFREFVTKCLNKDPKQRPSAAELLEHPFLKKANALDKAAICNLINESKAEVVELVEDLNEEDDISHMKKAMDEDRQSVELLTSLQATEMSKSEDGQEKLSVGGSTMANSRDRDVSTNNDTVTGVKSVKKLRAPGPPSTDIVTPSHSLHSVDSIDLTAADTSFSDKPASMAQHPELSVDVRPVESALLRDDSELSDNGVVDIGVKDGFEGDEVDTDAQPALEDVIPFFASELVEDVVNGVINSGTDNMSIPAVVFEVITEFVSSCMLEEDTGAPSSQAMDVCDISVVDVASMHVENDKAHEVDRLLKINGTVVSSTDISPVDPNKKATAKVHSDNEMDSTGLELNKQTVRDVWDSQSKITFGGRHISENGVMVMNDSLDVNNYGWKVESNHQNSQVQEESYSADRYRAIPQTDLDTFETRLTREDSYGQDMADAFGRSADGSDKKSDSDSVSTEGAVDRDTESSSGTAVTKRNKKQVDRKESRSFYRTLKKTRTYMSNGQVVTSTTTRVVASGQENKVKEEHDIRKQDLRELKLLQKLENKQYQDLVYKNQVATEAQERKIDNDMQNLIRCCEQDMDTLSKNQKQVLEKAELVQQQDMKSTVKRMRLEQDKDTKMFREKQKHEMKLLKQELDMMPRTTNRKDSIRCARLEKDTEMQEKEHIFQENQAGRLQQHMILLVEQHRDKISMLVKQFLQQKQQLLRAREAALWEMEREQLHEKNQLAKSQLKDMFFLKRHQMLTRHQKEIDQMKQYNSSREDELQQRHSVEKRRLPKILKAETKTRSVMFKQSLRLSLIATPDDDKTKLRNFETSEKKRMKGEQERQESKHCKQWEELTFKNQSAVHELEQLQAEKRKLLMEQETQRMRELEDEYSAEMMQWKSLLVPRKQRLEDEFLRQMGEQENSCRPTFYKRSNSDSSTSDNTSLFGASSLSAALSTTASARSSTII